jgi:hypothetical protein
MSRLIIALLLCASLLGCADADVDANAQANNNTVKTDIKTEVETFMKAHLESLIKAQIDTKVQGIGVDVSNKVADELKADIKSELETHIQAAIANNTQNVGMFSGGAIYVVIVAIVFLAFLFGTIIYLVKSLLKWKKIWHLVSHSIEEHCEDDDHGEHVTKIKSHFSSALEESGLKQLIDQNLEKRGFRKSLKR